MKTIGTLEEIGAQVGDVVEYHGPETWCYKGDCLVQGIDNVGWYLISGITTPRDKPYWRIITRAAKSPVRTVTRKEIVPGVYGRVTAERLDNSEWCFEVKSMRTTLDLTAAIATLTEIRDAMAGDA